jgi:hypothetical protein
MIDQTIPIPQLLEGMARCVREWILPDLKDPMARTQAELLATLLETLPATISPDAAASIRRDSGAARQLFEELGSRGASAPGTAIETVDDAMRENSALKTAIEELAAELRERTRQDAGDRKAADDLAAIQRFLVRSLAAELGTGETEGTDFESMTAKEAAARRK